MLCPRTCDLSRYRRGAAATLLAASLWCASTAGLAQEPVRGSDARSTETLDLEHLTVQALRRDVRFYRPARLADSPALVVVLHGGGGNGERFRRFTAGAFERLADAHGFLVAYPDGLGGQWKGCRSRAPHRAALAGVDDTTFLQAVVARAREIAGDPLAGVFVVGYSNGGHLAFRLALEAPEAFHAFAAVGAHLPVAQERDCRASGAPVSMFLVSGTEDPINPWTGGEVRAPGGAVLGRVLSAAATAEYFRALGGLEGEPAIRSPADRDVNDGVQVETRRWGRPGGPEVVLMVMNGGGHSLPHPDAAFPARFVGRTSRDLDAAAAIWSFFQRHLPQR